jgi:hypothetical protein
MKAGRIHHFGPPNAIAIEEIPRPTPEDGELVVRVAAAGVGPWDALIREGNSAVQVSLPLILGADLAFSSGPPALAFGTALCLIKCGGSNERRQHSEKDVSREWSRPSDL